MPKRKVTTKKKPTKPAKKKPAKKPTAKPTRKISKKPTPKPKKKPARKSTKESAREEPSSDSNWRFLQGLFWCWLKPLREYHPKEPVLRFFHDGKAYLCDPRESKYVPSYSIDKGPVTQYERCEPLVPPVPLAIIRSTDIP